MNFAAFKSRKNIAFVLLIGLSLSAVSATARGATVEAATQATTGQSLGIASVPNLRDLGGYKTSDGATVAGGLVYRANQLSGISPDDMEKLAELNLKVAYDLRTAEEREKRPDELPPGVEYVWLDVLADSPQAGPAQLEKLMQDPKEANAALGGGKVEAAFRQSYREFVSLPSAKSEFRKLFLALGDKEQLPAVFHCTTGKDRTGWAAAALLTLLGVPKEIVMEDYLRSNDYILPAYQEVIDGFVAAGGEPEIPLSILGVKKEYLDAAFDEMQTKYGTIEQYFSEGLGIDAAQQKALRDLYLYGMNAQAGEKNSDSKSGDEWVFSVSSYLWAAGITGTAGTLPNLPPTEVDESFSDIFDDLDFAGMMMVSARKGRFGMTGDLQYVETTAKDTAAAPIFLSQELVSKSFMLSLLGEYVALQEGNSVLRLSAGARLWSVDTELKLSSGLLPGIPGINVKHNETWVDPVVGVSGSVDVIGKVFLSGWGYVGGFGAGSDIMADLFGGVGYRFTDSISSRIGYRWMKVDYENDGFLYDVRQEGLIAGITFQF